MSRKAVFIYSPQFDKFNYPDDCPFNVSRAGKVYRLAKSMGLIGGAGVSEVGTEAAKRVTLKKFHTARYLHALQAAAKGKWDITALQMGIGTGDCPIFKDMYNYSAWACGATLTGVNMILAGQADAVFNPSGGLHHAKPEKAAGFCYINDVAIACLELAGAGKKVLYLDIDVHHGDGVQNAFYEQNDVMTISFHESGRTLFPGSGFEDEIGTGKGKGYCVNFPVPVGTYDEAYMRAFNEIAASLIPAFNPDVIVFELGADALAGDPLSHLRLTNNTYVKIINYLLSLNVPILMAGGGGYNIENTVRAWTLAWSVLSGSHDSDITMGMGGVMLESTDWLGGLKDRQLSVTNQQRQVVEPAIDSTIEYLKKTIFPIHGL